jgi:NAD(P)-dependent dehydrogenase (short-subunit alcohol dehydrogenase family)
MATSMRGKTVVITGASSGIGAAAARALAQAGATVVPIGRSPAKTEAVAREIGVEPLLVDFADFSSIRRMAVELQRRVDRIDVLAHNAGGMVHDREITIDGFERTMQSNYLGPFLLNSLLERQLRKCATRVIVTSSISHHFGGLRLADLGGTDRRYSMVKAYGMSKLADLLFARQLARRGFAAVGFDPGFVATDFLLPVTGLAAANADEAKGMHRVRRVLLNVIEPDEAAKGIVRFATTDSPQMLSGKLISPTRTISSSPKSRSRSFAEALWARTEEVLRLSRA